MERLTEKAVGCFEYALKDHKAVPGEFGTYDAFFDYSMAVKRLGHYEDTGLEPEDVVGLKNTCDQLNGINDSLFKANQEMGKDLAEWKKANDEDRLVVLPCKVGDVVYGFHQERTILPMVAKWIETDADGWTVAAQYAPMAPKFYLFSDFGKTVFLTREEAEAALKGGEG